MRNLGAHTLQVSAPQDQTRVTTYQYSISDGSAPMAYLSAPSGNQHVSHGGDCPWDGDHTGYHVPVPPCVLQPDKKPQIASVTGTLLAGGAATITITGSNFGGVAGMLNFCQAGSSPCVLPSSLPWMSQCLTSACGGGSWSDTQITAVVTLPSVAEGTPAGHWQFYISPVYCISAAAFLAPALGDVEVAASPTLTVTSNGTRINAGDCIYIDATPQTPTITATVVPPGDGQFQLVINFTQRTSDTTTQTLTRSYPATGPLQPKTSETWNISPFGDQAAINWSYQGASQSSFNFCIKGTNPDNATALVELNQYTGRYWFLPNTAILESGLNHFNPTGSLAGLPNWGSPAGYGIAQVDPPPSADTIWNWRVNIADAVAELDGKAGPVGGTSNQNDQNAYPFWVRQVKQWQDYNAANPNAPIPPPQDQPEAPGCTFSYTSGNGTVLTAPTQSSPYWFGDAELIKQYNGAPLQYVSFLQNGNPVRWSFVKDNNKNNNYVGDTCTCSTVALCQHHPK